MDSKGGMVKKQEQTTTKQKATRKIHVNKLHLKLGHPEEERIHVTANHLHYSIKGVLYVCENCANANIKHKLLRKVEEDRDLHPGEMI